MSLAEYFIQVRNLNNVERWSVTFMHKKTNVAQHQFHVAQIGQIMGMIEEKNGAQINWRTLYAKLLNHDVPEALTGDIISTTKNKNLHIAELMGAIEIELVEEHILRYAEEEFREDLRQLIFQEKDETLEGQILKYADIIDALIECAQEIKLANNVPFVNKYNTMLEALHKSPLKSVEYFLKNVLPQF